MRLGKGCVKEYDCCIFKEKTKIKIKLILFCFVTLVPPDAEKVNYRKPSFISKFLELNKVMWDVNKGLTASHPYDSRPEVILIVYSFFFYHHGNLEQKKKCIGRCMQEEQQYLIL